MDSCFALVGARQHCVAKICNASQGANIHSNIKFISSSHRVISSIYVGWLLGWRYLSSLHSADEPQQGRNSSPLLRSCYYQFLSCWCLETLFHVVSALQSCLSIQSNLRLQPPTVTDHLSSVTSFTKYQKFPSQITIFGKSCKRPPLVSDLDHF